MTNPWLGLVFIAAAAALWGAVVYLTRTRAPRHLPPLPPDEYRALYADLDAFERGQRP